VGLASVITGLIVSLTLVRAIILLIVASSKYHMATAGDTTVTVASNFNEFFTLKLENFEACETISTVGEDGATIVSITDAVSDLEPLDIVRVIDTVLFDVVAVATIVSLTKESNDSGHTVLSVG